MDSEIPLGFTQWKSSDDTDNDRIILNTIGEHAEVKVTNLKLIFDSKKINWFPRLRVVSMKTVYRKNDRQSASVRVNKLHFVFQNHVPIGIGSRT